MRARTLAFMAIFFMAASPAFARSVEVQMMHGSFDTDKLTINIGDTVVFKNNDSSESVFNILVVDSQGRIDDKGMQKSGMAVSEQLIEPGIYFVRCGLHPKMNLRITVAGHGLLK